MHAGSMANLYVAAVPQVQGYQMPQGGRKSQESLPNLDQLQSLATGTLNHRGPLPAHAVGLLEYLHAFLLELREPSVQSGHAQPDVVGEMASRTHQRRLSLANIGI